MVEFFFSKKNSGCALMRNNTSITSFLLLSPEEVKSMFFLPSALVWRFRMMTSSLFFFFCLTLPHSPDNQIGYYCHMILIKSA